VESSQNFVAPSEYMNFMGIGKVKSSIWHRDLWYAATWVLDLMGIDDFLGMGSKIKAL